MKKNSLRQIRPDEISISLPDLKNSDVPKAVTISKWIMEWIDTDLEAGRVEIGNLLPGKAEFAYLLGVSIGTIQNSLRFVEDAGYVISKQCIGTVICDRIAGSEVRKLTSKREIAIESIKKFIRIHKYKIGENLPSSRILSKEIESSANTTRLALENLCSAGVLEHNFKNSKDACWVVKSLKFEISENIEEQTTLVEKVEQDLKDYITENLKIGDKIPAHSELAKILNVSIKTIHDALKNLTGDGILLPRRGRYGTSVIKMPNDNMIDAGKETSIFASAKDTAFYYYERTQNHIKRIISENYSVGDRLPSIMEMSRRMDLSPNTIRKAFQNLAAEGYLSFSRGRYGGTFVIDIPETESGTFKWLAVNPKYAKLEN